MFIPANLIKTPNFDNATPNTYSYITSTDTLDQVAAPFYFAGSDIRPSDVISVRSIDGEMTFTANGLTAMPSAEEVARVISGNELLSVKINEFKIYDPLTSEYGVTYSEGVQDVVTNEDYFKGKAISLLRPATGTANSIFTKRSSAELTREQTKTVAMRVRKTAQDQADVYLTLGNYDSNASPSDGLAKKTIDANYPANVPYWYFFNVDDRGALSTFTSFNSYQARLYNNTPTPLGAVIFDCIIANAGSKPVVTISFDDAHASTYTIARSILNDANLAATVYIPAANIGQSERLTWDQLRTLRDDGWGMSLNGTSDDTEMTTRSSAVVAAQEAAAQMEILTAQSLDSQDMYHMCYPNGTWFGAGTFANGNLQTELANVGFVTARRTGSSDYLSTFGFDGGEMFLPGYGFSGATLNQAIDYIDAIVNRGTTVEFYIHRVDTDPVGWTADTPNAGIHVYRSFLIGLVARIQFLNDSGIISVMTKRQAYEHIKTKSNVLLSL